MTWSWRELDTPRVRFDYATAGAGRPVVLLPGAGGWYLTFAGLGAALARDRQVVAVDPPGQGTTSIHDPAPTFGVDDVVASLEDFCRAADLGRVDVVGHSWGGGYALRLAELHPDRVGRLVLLAPAGVPHPDVWELRLARRRLVGELGVRWFARPAARRLLVKSFADRRRVPRDRLARALTTLGHGAGARTLRHDTLRVERSVDWTATAAGLPTVGAPALVLWGEQDRILPVTNLERLADVPDLTRSTVAGAGHALHDERPDVVQPQVTRFLDRPEP